jgi:cyclophilin family peptidyl-prolyl cis-trans isomerase/protein-disulfide isomerase
MRPFKTLVILTFIFFLSITSCTASPTTPPEPTPTLITVPTTPPSCITLAAAPTPGPEAPSLFPPVNEADHVQGSTDAIVTIMVYGDYQDAPSGTLARAINQLIGEYPDRVRFISRLFPLNNVNDKALLSAQAAEAAGKQDKFRGMYNLLYEQQENWVNLSVEDFEQWVTAQASALGMDAGQFRSDLKSEEVVAKIQQAVDESQKMSLPGVPLIIINGQIYAGPRDYNSLNDIVQLIALGERQFTSCPSVVIQTGKSYIATLHTEKGDVVIELFADKAPVTVNSFIFLAQNGWYDNITFHRVIPDIFAQSGDPSGTGKGNPGYYLVNEIVPTLTFDKPGMVAMVNSGPNSTGSQFFINYAPTEQFNGKYAIFGQVLSDMDVLESLTPRDAQPGGETPPGDQLLSIEVMEQ